MERASLWPFDFVVGVIPYEHGRRLFAAAGAPKRFVDIRGGHEDAYRIDKVVYYGAIADFLRDVTDTPLTSAGTATTTQPTNSKMDGSLRPELGP